MQNINKKILKNLFPKINLSNITIEQIGGLTNKNYLLKEDDILYKSLKQGFDDFIDRNLEQKLLQKIQGFPKVYHFDKDLMIRQYLSDHKIIKMEQLNQDKLQVVFDRIFHLNNLQSEFFNNTDEYKFKELLIDENFLNRISNFLNEHKQYISKEETKNFEKILDFFYKNRSTLLNFLKRYPKENITLCHNDINIPNILINQEGNIVLLDYEYSNLNPLHYDVANFFVEASIDYHDKPPYFTVTNQSKLQNLKEMVYNIYQKEKDVKSKNEFLENCEIFQIYSHFFWLNVTIKSIKMNIQLDLNEYAKQRFDLMNGLYKKYLDQ